LTLAEVLEPSIELCGEGFQAHPGLVSFVQHFAARLAEWPSSGEVFLPGGKPLQVGDTLVQVDLARLFEQLIVAERAARVTGASRADAIEAARRSFYCGEIGERIARFMELHDWPLTLADLSEYKVRVETAPHVTYRGYDVHVSGPWSQGPMVAISLNLLEGFDLNAMGITSPELYHHYIEAIKLAAADREGFFGDPELVDVPLSGLLSKAYAAERRALIDPGRACLNMFQPGNPWRFEGRDAPPGYRPSPAEGVGSPDTSYVCAIDSEGNAFSATPSDHVCGAPLVSGLGIIVSHRGAQLWLDSAHPSAMAPGKRPRLTPNPAMVVRNGEPIIAFGSPGEDMQTQAMVQFLTHRLDFGLDLQSAIE